MEDKQTQKRNAIMDENDRREFCGLLVWSVILAMPIIAFKVAEKNPEAIAKALEKAYYLDNCINSGLYIPNLYDTNLTNSEKKSLQENCDYLKAKKEDYKRLSRDIMNKIKKNEREGKGVRKTTKGLQMRQK